MSETSQTGSENEKSKTNRPPRKRQVHNEVERRRKSKINSWISKISELLPNKELHKKSKICILEQTVDYIKELVVERDKLLSEQCSDVQLEEVRKLKKELNLVQEQNRVYTKLLQQANISLSSLPKKAAKYSNKFTERNGLQLLQQAEQADRQHISSPPQEDGAMQVSSSVKDSIDTSIALVSVSTCSQIILQTSPSLSSTAAATNIKDHSIGTTVGKILSTAAGCNAQNISTVPVLPTCIVSTKTTSVPSSSAFINSQGTIPSFTSGSAFSAKTAVSVGTGGVTPALSPFPLMSTTLSSSVSDIYSKSVRMILMPSSTPIPTERVTLSNLNIASSLVHTLPISVPKTVASHCIISPLNYGSTLNVLPESTLISNSVQISTDPLPNSAVCINVANGFLNSGFIIAPVVSSSGNSSSCVKAVSQANVSEMVSSLPMACENLQSIVPPAVPLTQECSVLSNSASQVSVTSNSHEVCMKVLQPVMNDVQSASLSKSRALGTESVSLLSTKVSKNVSSSGCGMSDMEISSHPSAHSADPCVNVISENHVTHSENSLNLATVSSENNECQAQRAGVEVMPVSTPLSLKILCTRTIMLFSRNRPNTDVSPHLSFSNISDSVVQDEIIQSQSQESVSNFHSLPEDNSKTTQNSPSVTGSLIHCVPGSTNTVSSMSVETSGAHEVHPQSLDRDKSVDTLPDGSHDVSTSGSRSPVPTCATVINDSSSKMFILGNSAASGNKFVEPQKATTGDKNTLVSSTDGEACQGSSSSRKSKISATVPYAVISDSCSKMPVNTSQSNINASQCSFPKSVEAGLKHTEIVTCTTSPSKNCSVTVSKCTSQMVPSASVSSTQTNAQNAPRILTANEHSDISKSSNPPESTKSILCNFGIKPAQPVGNESTLYPLGELNSEQSFSRTESEKNSVPTSESNLSSLPSLFHNSQYYSPPCLNIQPSSSVINIPVSSVSGNNKPVPEKSAVISSANLSLSSVGYGALLPTHNVIPLMASSVSSLAPSYCIGASDKDKTGTLSFPIILSGYSECDVIENKGIFPNMDANFNINFLNANFSSTVQKPHQPPCSKKRSKLVTKKAKSTVSGKAKVYSTSSDSVGSGLPSTCSSKYQSLPSDVESVELHKSSLDQPSLFLSNDILAKATESIFCNSILDGGQGSAECQEEMMNSVTEHSPPLDSANCTACEDFVSPKLGSKDESSKKNPPVSVSGTESVSKSATVPTVSHCDQNPKANEMISPPGQEKEGGNDLKEKSVPRIRKSNVLDLEEGEPQSKRAKEDLNKAKEPSATQTIRPTEFCVNKLVAQEESSKKNREEPFNSVENVSRENTLLTINVKDSNGLQSTCNNPKSLSSNENSFPSATPSFGEILKDVSSHGMIHFNSRSSVATHVEGHVLLPSEKSVATTDNSGRSTGDEFLQLPQSYFPATSNASLSQLSSSSEIPFCQSVNSQASESCKTLVTSSVASPRQDNKKKVNDPSQWAEKNNSDAILPYANALKEKDANNVPKQSCATESSLQNSTGVTTYVYPESNNLVPTISTAEIIPASSSKSMSNQFGIQNVCVSMTAPMIPPNINFNRVSSSGSQVEQNFLHASPPPLLSRNYGCQNNSQAIPFSSHSVESLNAGVTHSMSSQSPSASSESLSHSLCSLLKDTSSQLANIPGKNASITKNAIQTSTPTYSSTPTTSISHSKYSALSLISHQTFSGPSSGISTSLPLLQPSMMTASSCQQMSNPPATTYSLCNRNARPSLSYSAENLIHGQSMDVDKDKNKTIISGGYFPHKKGEQDLVPGIHDVGDSNIFMPLGGSEMNTQSMNMVPLPPVTSFPSFQSNYPMCETGPPVSLRCSATMDRTQDLPLQLPPNEGSFLRHASINEPSSATHSDRHIAHSASMTSMAKPHSNLPLSFESHSSFYNNCNFLQHPKSNLDSSAVSDNSPCFQATAFNSGYAQSIQKQNCCHFSHQSHSGLITDTSLPIITSVGPFHAEKNDSLMNRPSLESNSSQNCSNYIGNIFYDSSCNRQVVGTKPSSVNLSQELYSPLGVRQNSHHNVQSSGSIQNQRKNIASGKTKSKKVKQALVSESSVNTNAAPNSNSTSNVNFFSVPEISCSKSNMPPVPNCYFKNSHQTPSSLQPPNEKNKLPENILSSPMPPNPPFNPILHSQNEGILNLNFQPPNFGMSSLSRPPPPPSLCCSCITSPVITQTFTTAATHPVPNFNLSNILPDMGCSSSESVTLSPIKFHPPSHMLPAPPPPPSVPSQCQGDTSQGSSGHALARQGSGPSLYPTHPPVIHNTFSPLLNHASHGLNRNHIPMSGSGTSCTAPQSATFVPTQPPPFRNVIQSLNFSRSDR